MLLMSVKERDGVFISINEGKRPIEQYLYQITRPIE